MDRGSIRCLPDRADVIAADGSTTHTVLRLRSPDHRLAADVGRGPLRHVGIAGNGILGCRHRARLPGHA